jgi:hypothetical protein
MDLGVLYDEAEGDGQLIASCAAYRSALMALSTATAAFADAMGNCAGCVGN